MSRVLIISADVVGERMAGPGIRAWEFGRLLQRENEVTLAAPSPLPRQLPGFRVVEALRSVISREAQACDALVIQGSALDLFPSLHTAGKPMVVDLYDPYMIENLEVHADQSLATRLKTHDQDLAVLRHQVLAGDFFLCASERQRHLWLGVLTAFNRVNPLTYEQDPTLRKLLAVVPFGLSDEPLRPSGPGLRESIPGIGKKDFVVLWGGGVWNWFDPLTLIRAVAQVAADHPQLRLVFMGTTHPNVSVPKARMTAQALELARELGVEGRHVFFREGWLPYEERQAFLAEADAGASLHFEHVETTFAFRTRILDYLWAGLPMLLTAGDSLAELAQREGLGVVVAAEDTAAVATGLRRLIEDAEYRKACAAASKRVSEGFRWSVVGRPLVEFCHAPYRSADAGRRAAAALPGLGDRLPGRRSRLAGKAWRSLRHDGFGAFATRSWRYLRRRLG